MGEWVPRVPYRGASNHRLIISRKMERHFFAQQRFYEISVFYLYWHMYVAHFDTFLNLFSVGLLVLGLCECFL